jgi:Arc-like DNA binding domain
VTRTTQFNIRALPELKKSLDEAAARNGRSVSEEVISRLERSFVIDILMGTEKVSNFHMVLASGFTHTGMDAARLAGRADWQDEWSWRDDPWCYEQAALRTAYQLWIWHPRPNNWDRAQAWLTRLVAKIAIHCKKTMAELDDLEIKPTREDLAREGEPR